MARKRTVERWADCVSLEARFRRSIHLERDAHDLGALRGYILTPLARQTLRRIANGIAAGSRAWSLTGPYGSGKSAFALCLSSLFGRASLPETRAARALLKGQDDALYEETLGHRSGAVAPEGLLVVGATAERRSLNAILLDALGRAAAGFWSGRGAKPAALREVERVARQGQSTGVATKEIVGLFEGVAKAVADSSAAGTGLLIVLDEAGKILEHAAQHPGEGDLQLLQELAEAANRSGATPIILVTVLHQAFERYAGRLHLAQRNEWAKVQGRFEDVAFLEASDQLLRLVGHALHKSDVPAAAIERGHHLARELATSSGTDRENHELVGLLASALPLHPVTALVLGPLFRSQLAQNERSLFAFLGSAEPHGFQEFLARPLDGGGFYPIDHLYDYVASALGGRIYGQHGRAWARIETALQRLPPDAGDLEGRLIKAIGVIGALGERSGIVANESTLRIAMCGHDDLDGTALAEALARLSSASLILYRKYLGAYQLWEGSDLDLDSLVQQAASEVDARADLVERLDRLVPPRPLVARRHLLKTGTLRYCAVHYVSEGWLEQGVPPASEGDADGVIAIVIPDTAKNAETLRARLLQPMMWLGHDRHTRPVIVAVPSDPELILELAVDGAALERVQSSTPELQADPVARRELSGRLLDVESRLRTHLVGLLGSAGGCQWYNRAKELSIGSAAELGLWVSKMFDAVFDRSPIVHNELLNRRYLSSAAAAARRSLMQAMIERRDQAVVGFEGCPPEVSMYKSVLEEHGLHGQVDGQWRLLAPTTEAKGSMLGAYQEIDKILRGQNGNRVRLTDLYQRMRNPPFGIRDGVLPVLVLAYVLVVEEEIALYEDDAFVPSISAALIERLLRAPEKFEVQHYAISGGRAELFAQLLELFTTTSVGRSRRGPLVVVRQLVKLATTLPDYSKRTAEVGERTKAVRDALLRAREPGSLLFRDLPIACGMEAFGAEGGASAASAQEMVSRLRAALRELQNVYPRLLERVQSEVSEILALPSEFGAARRELRARALAVSDAAVDIALKGFLIRVADESLDDRAWLVSIATLLGGKPPEVWLDLDMERARANLQVIARRLKALEGVLYHEVSRAMPPGARLMRLAITKPGAAESDSVIAVRSEDEQAVSELVDAIGRQLELNSPDIALAALAEAASAIISARDAAGAQEEAG